MCNVDLEAESFTVHAREKISTGDYENAEYHVSIEGSIDADGDLDADRRRELKARLLTVEKDAQDAVARACENRIAADGHEDWGVSADE